MPLALCWIDSIKPQGSLKISPMLAPEGRVEGTREFVVHKHYILVYEIINETVIILAVLHTSKQYPPIIQ